jgi:hypothetical protein
MLEMGTSGLMSGEGKRINAARLRHCALPRLYLRLAETNLHSRDTQEKGVFTQNRFVHSGTRKNWVCRWVNGSSVQK